MIFEKKNLSKELCSFRYARLTIDNLITIKTEIENAFEHTNTMNGQFRYIQSIRFCMET